MKRSTRCKQILALGLTGLFAFGCATLPQDSENGYGSTLRLRNNHELPYGGPVQFETDLPDGTYGGARATGEVRSGLARMVPSLPAGSEVVLSRTGPLRKRLFHRGPLSVSSSTEGLDLDWANERLGSLELGLVVRPGTGAGPDDVIPAFEALDIRWEEQRDGTIRGEIVEQGFKVEATLAPYGGGWLDVRTRLTRVEASPASAYVALVRRVTVPEIADASLRFNGRVLDGPVSPDTWERDFWYTRGVDWVSWETGNLSLAAINGFSPVSTIQRDSKWAEGSHFYVWERTRREGNRLYLISEVSGPNPEQARSGYMKVTPYAPMREGDAVELKWRLALEQDPSPGWEESQLRVFAGYRSADRTSGMTVVELGVPAVAFGTSYFPYSTIPENFDYYRTPGLNQETWWAFSPTLWSNWQAFIPRMRADLHIIRAMGFDWVRLHHLELLQQMDRAEAFAFLDWFTDAARELDLKILSDTEGPAEWITQLAARYGDVITSYELENEILIQGIEPEDPARWTALYEAAKQAAPQAQVFLTAAGNDAMFERLRDLGVPFDRVGLHAYKHGPEWKEAFSSHALGTAGYASDLGKAVTLGEFNWKGFTRLSPEARRKEFVATYEEMLEPRAIPQFFQFHFQETLSVNPSISRSGIRHYETISLDRRPKPEAIELMRLIRQYTRQDAPVREVPIEVSEARFIDRHASVPFTVSNSTPRTLTLELSALAFGGIESRLRSSASVTLQSGEVMEGSIELRLKPEAEPGTYHHFLKAAYADKDAYGWGIASNAGALEFEGPVLKDRVAYPQGAGVVQRFDWNRPLAVAFGPDAPVLEMEMAYIVANTLQSATGSPIRLSSTADLPDSLMSRGNLILVGTRGSNPLMGSVPEVSATGEGTILLRNNPEGTQWLLLTGSDKEAVQAAATDFVLRYWQNAKDAAIRIAGMEEGAALGNPAGINETDLP